MRSLGTRVLGISIYCPHCHRHTSIERAPAEVIDGFQTSYVPACWKKSSTITWWIGVCNYCNEPVLAKNEGETICPDPLPKPTDKSVPDEIRRDLDEAKRCLAVCASRAAAVMARRAMQSAAIAKGTEKTNLAEQIAELAAQGRITLDLKQWADEVRWIGNDAAHPGGQTLSSEDAGLVVALAEQILHYLYVTPAIAESLRNKKK